MNTAMQVKGRCRGDCKPDPRESLLLPETRKVSGIYGLVWLLRKSCPSNTFLTYIPKDILEIPVLQDTLFNSIFKGYHGQIKLVHGACIFSSWGSMNLLSVLRGPGIKEYIDCIQSAFLRHC